MNKAENIDELATAWTLSKNQVAAIDLLLAHEKKLIGLRKWLIGELTEKTNEAPTFIIHGPGAPSNEEFIGLLINLVNEQRVQKRLKPLSIPW